MGSSGETTVFEPVDHRFNYLLPESYRNQLKEEAREQLIALRVIAENIGEKDELDQSENESYKRQAEVDLGVFEKGLSRYLDLKYVLDASDFELFIRTCMRGVLTRDIDLGLRAKLARTIVRVLRKRTCNINFGLPWRSVRDLIVKIHIDSADGGEYIGKDIRDAHCRNLISLLRKCRNFLEEGDSAERIWNELGTQIDPSRAISAFEPLLILSHVLPTRGQSWTGWLPSAASTWQKIETSSDWDSIWLGLFARLAKNQPLAVDWTPYLKQTYERIPSAFRLPLGSVAPQSAVERRSPAHCVFLLTEKLSVSAAVFCVYTLTPRGRESFDYFKRLIALIANFFHPSNGGRWSSYLASFLGHLTANLTSRVALEKSATEGGVMERVLGSNTRKPVAPMEDRLSEELIVEIVQLLLPLVELGLHAKNGYMSVQAAASVRDLAAIAPELVVNPMLEAASAGLGSISSPHRTSAALKMLATLTPVFLDSKICPNGIESLPQALELTLPGIDPNDPSKTEATFRFIAGASARLQALLVNGRGADMAMFLEDFAHQLLDRVFALLEALEAPPKKNKGGSSASSAPVLSPFIFSVAMENFFGAVPPSVAVRGAEMIARQISGAASINALKFYGILVRISAAAAAAASTETGSGSSESSSAGIFLPILLNQIVEKEKDEMVLACLSDEELLWRLRMLAQACRSCGDIKPYGDRLLEAALLAMRHSSRSVYKSGGRLLRGLLEGLTAGKIQFGSGIGDDFEEGKEYQINWWQPQVEEWTLAEKIIRTSLAAARDLIEKDGKVDLSDRENVFKAIRILHATQRGGRWLMSGALTEKAKRIRSARDKPPTKAEAKYIVFMPIIAGLGGELGEERDEIAKSLWREIYSFVQSILLAVETERPNDSSLVYRCLEPIELAHEPFRRSTQGRMTAHAARGYKTAYKPVMAMKRKFHAPGGAGRMMPRFILKLRVEALHELRLGLSARGGYACSDIFEDMLQTLSRFSLNDFPKVRGEARGVLTRALRVAPSAVRKEHIGLLIDVLDKSSNTQDKDSCNYEKMMGAADVLRSSGVSPYVMREWHLFRPTALAVLKAMIAAERPDVASVVGGLHSKLASLVRPLGINPIELVKPNLHDVEFLDDGTSEKLLHEHQMLNKELVAMVNSSNGIEDSESRPAVDMHWKIQSLVATTLYTNLREEFPPLIEVAAFFAESMASDLLTLRLASKKAVSLILALQRRKSSRSAEDDLVCGAIEKVFQKDDYPQRLLHTLGLDEGMDLNERGLSDGLGALSLLSLAKHIDGDACWALVSGRPWPSSWVPRSRDTLIINRVRLIETLFYSFGSPLLKCFKGAVSSLMNSEDPIPGLTKENTRVLAAEVIAGIGRGMQLKCEEDSSRSATQEDVDLLTTWAKSLLEAFSGHEGMVNGGSMIRLLVSCEEGRLAEAVVKTLRDDIFRHPLLEVDAPAHQQARRLRYLHTCVADENPNSTTVPVAEVIPLLTDFELLAHPLKHVREEIARCMSLLSSFTMEETRMVYMKCVQKVAAELKGQADTSDTEMDEEAKKRRSRVNDTVSRWVSVVHWNGDTHVFGDYLTVMLPCLFTSLDDSDPDRTLHAKLALSLAAQAKLSEEQIDEVLVSCEEAARSKRWRIRGSVLPFLQVLAFSRLFVMSSTQMSRVRNIVIGLLGDEQLEVREAATHTLVPLIRDAPAEAISETRSLLNERLQKTRSRSRKKSRTPMDSKTLLDRHSAVLGLSSMVMSSPYAVPAWMPGVLVALTTCIDDPPPISTSARKLFAEFWRTHRDEWDTLKHAFNEEELETVSELLISPSYYA